MAKTNTVFTATWFPNVVVLARVVIGIIFLWAGLEKFIGGAGAWTAKGFLAFGTSGTLGWPFVTGAIAEGTVFNPTHDIWVSLSSNEGMMKLVDFMVQFGQISIGIALILGVATRFAATMGALMMTFFFFAAWDFAYGIVNQHFAYAVVTFGLAVIGAGNYRGVDAHIGSQLPSWARKWLASGEPAGA